MPEWNDLFKDERYIWKNPHEGVEELAGLLKGSANRRVLDLGCGAGRHLVYLAREGFQVVGTDISEVGLEHAHRWLKQEGLSAETRLADMTTIPYPDDYFGGVVSAYVIFHNTLAGMRQSIQEIQRREVDAKFERTVLERLQAGPIGWPEYRALKDSSLAACRKWPKRGPQRRLGSGERSPPRIPRR